MKYATILISFILILSSCQDRSQASEANMKHKKLTTAEERVIVQKGTEAPFSGQYWNFHGQGSYVCKRCGADLFRSMDKFDSDCGWPSFDDEIPGAVRRQTDADGQRTEILCANCGAHLGHVFVGERFTAKNTRHCANSISMDFIPADQQGRTERAIFASGCFWGTQYYLQQARGVIATSVGYTGGRKANPTYQDVGSGTTGHAEAVEVVFDPARTSFEALAKLYFETHDFTQVNRQGPDIGEQYRSEIFFLSEQQKSVAKKLIAILTDKGYHVATRLTPAGPFYKAEEYHQDYYRKNGHTPYCHLYRRIF